MILYEYPFQESVRTMLRLEQLFDRLGQLMVRDTPVDHHFALVTLFEIMDVASRADLKSDLLKELERHKQQLLALRGNAQVAQETLDDVIRRIEQAFDALNQLARQSRPCPHPQRMADERAQPHQHPGRHLRVRPAWLLCVATPRCGQPARRSDSVGVDHDAARAGICRCCCSCCGTRASGRRCSPAPASFSRDSRPGRPISLLRVRMDPATQLIPEISGHRLMVSIRLMRVETDGRLRPSHEDAAFELALCA